MNSFGDILQQLNEEARNIFGLVQKQGPLTKNRLVQITGMKLTTLNRIMEPLEASGFLVENGTEESSGGRKPSLYSINSNKYVSIGIDISRTYAQVLITSIDMEIKYKKLIAMDESCTPQKTVNDLSLVITEAIENLKLQKQSVLGIGIGTVGPLDRSKGVIINPVNFPAPGWNNVPIKSMVEDKLGLPVFIDNGANTSVLAEYLFGKGKNYGNTSYFICGVGIRTGAISSGIIVRTINDTEDAFGHMVIDVDGDKCTCGNYGCIECYSSIPSITNKFVSAMKKGRNSIVIKPVDQINYLDICSAAANGDELAREIIISAATIFGAGLANYINLLSPGLVILSGPLISHSELFYMICTETALKKYYSKAEHKVYFSKGGCFGDNAISLGAAAMVIEKLLDSRTI